MIDRQSRMNISCKNLVLQLILFKSFASLNHSKEVQDLYSVFFKTTLLIQLYVRIGIVITYGKRLHDRLEGMFGSIKLI